VKRSELVGLVIKELREELGMTQAQLAELLGVSERSVCNWETGTTELRGKNFEKMLQDFRLSPGQFGGRMARLELKVSRAAAVADPPDTYGDDRDATFREHVDQCCERFKAAMLMLRGSRA
jgi:transcriptional regulator with XRE-family HTH domain